MHALIEKLEEMMNDENRIVTVPLFAQEAQISFKEAREALNQFIEIHKNVGEMHATYVLNGIQKNTEKLCLIQVNNETIESLKDSFENEPEKSIFSIQKPSDINYNVISLVDKIQDFSKFGTIVGKNCIKRSIKKRILPTLPVPTIKGKSSMFLKPNTSESMKKEEKNGSNDKNKETQSNNAKTSIESLFNKAVNAEIKSEKKSKVSEKKSSKENTALSGFFTKSLKESKTVNTTIKPKKENLENKSIKVKDYVFDSDTDEEDILNDLDFHKEAEKTQKVSTSVKNEKVEDKSTTSASSESIKNEKTKSLENSKKKLKFESNSKSSIKSLFDKSVEAARQCSMNKSSNLSELKYSKEKEEFLTNNSTSESKTLKTVKNSLLEENKLNVKNDLFDSDTDEDILNDLDYHKEAEITKKSSENKKAQETTNNKNQRKNKKSTNDKKRKRIVVEDNNSDSDNDIVGSEKSDNEEIIESSIIEEKSSEQSVPKSKRRKTVQKVCEDDDGFMVTKFEYVFETASEEENEPDNKIPKKIEEAPPKPNKLQQQKTSSNSEMEISPTENGKKKKKGSTKSKPTNQPTLMNFFKKK